MTTADRVVCSDETHLAATVAQALVERLSTPGVHHLVLTGGGVGTRVLVELCLRSQAVDWTRVHVWWSDERFLPAGDPERNETAARAALDRRAADWRFIQATLDSQRRRQPRRTRMNSPGSQPMVRPLTSMSSSWAWAPRDMWRLSSRTPRACTARPWSSQFTVALSHRPRE